MGLLHLTGTNELSGRRPNLRLVRQHGLDGGPFIIREFVAYDSSPQFGSLNHGGLAESNLSRSSWRFGAEADINQPTTSAETVENEPKLKAAPASKGLRSVIHTRVTGGSVGDKCVPRLCTASHVLDPTKEENNYYYADAEVDLEFGSSIDEHLRQAGIVFNFKLEGEVAAPRHFQNLVGHFDFKSPVVGKGWPRETGSARVCLHNLTLNHKLPHGSPLAVGQHFEIARGSQMIGVCRVTAVIQLSKQTIFLCRPNASSFVDERQQALSRREA